MIYGFALSGRTSRILYKLRQIDCCYIVSPNNIEQYLEMLIHDQPEYILGLGTYSGVDQDKIRIETICTNQFRNEYLDSDIKQQVDINPYLQSSSVFKYTNAIGNSHCNLVSWKIMQLINSSKLKSKYTFLHIPKNMNPGGIREIIDNSLLEYCQKLNGEP